MLAPGLPAALTQPGPRRQPTSHHLSDGGQHTADALFAKLGRFEPALYHCLFPTCVPCVWLPYCVAPQVCGFERQQLSSLFSGIMSHLLAHVSNALQQQQQGAGTAEGRRRRQAAEVSPAEASAAVDQEAYRQQVAAALAAHVSARVPFNSSLAPHVLHILQDQVRTPCQGVPACLPVLAAWDQLPAAWWWRSPAGPARNRSVLTPESDTQHQHQHQH